MNRPIGALVCVATLIGLLFLPSAAQAQGSRWERQVQRYIRETTRKLGDEGYERTGQNRSGALNTSETESFTLMLRAGGSYVVSGACDDDCTELDLALYAANGYEVDVARESGNAPILRVVPRETMVYRVKVVMAICRTNPCSYGIAVFVNTAKRPLSPPTAFKP
ncbi:MAG: hypothetical protein ACREMW_13730 [Gemmatimonadales bacterium]